MPLNLLEAKGSSAIPPTPFDENDKIDIKSLERVYEFIVQCDSTSITTPVMVSEFESLSEDERKLMIRVACEVVNGRCAIIANTTAPCMHQAANYAEYAQKCGADSVIAMGPAGTDYAYVKRFFKAISDAVSIPVMIQNHSGAGFMLSSEQVIELCETIENVKWVKEERQPGPISVGNVNAIRTPALEGIMSGYGSQYAPLDFARGAIACIHACEWADLVQPVWDLFFEGKEEEARAMHYATLPALQLEGLLGMRYAKEVLRRRGVFSNTTMRRASRELSADDHAEIDRIFLHVEPYMKTIKF